MDDQGAARNVPRIIKKMKKSCGRQFISLVPRPVMARGRLFIPGKTRKVVAELISPAGIVPAIFTSPLLRAIIMPERPEVAIYD